MLKNITFKFGAPRSPTPLSVDLTGVTIFVGPNNSGKSRTLQEIQQFCLNGRENSSAPILQSASFRSRNDAAAALAVERVLDKSRDPQAMTALGQIRISVRGSNYIVDEAEFRGIIKDPSKAPYVFANQYARGHIIKLDGIHRLGLVDGVQSGNISALPSTPLQAIWKDNEKRKEWRRIVYQALGFYPTIDPTNVGQLQIKASQVEPVEDQERSWKETAVEFHKNTIPIVDYSDGVKAFTGIMLQVIAGEPELLLIDEPEAFLHPALCFFLGREITKFLSKKKDGEVIKQIVAATHSPDFLMGCIQAKEQVNIIRLTYDKSTGTARTLAHSQIIELMRKPILRSAKALSALFYNAVIITEADADRAFYQELNERLIEFKNTWGIESCLFLNANGKDAIPDIAEPLRAVGIPTAMIVDIDVKNGGASWAKFMSAGRVPEIDRPSFEVGRKNLLDALVEADADFKRHGGITLLAGDAYEAAENFIRRLSEYGIFVVPHGEVEAWLSNLDVDRNKRTWLATIFSKLGEDPESPAYIRPGDGDVWEFLFGIKNWLANKTRRGV
jgi:predicted ATPase